LTSRQAAWVCAAAHAIAPGKSLAFAMQVRVPKLAANGLLWASTPSALGRRRCTRA